MILLLEVCSNNLSPVISVAGNHGLRLTQACSDQSSLGLQRGPEFSFVAIGLRNPWDWNIYLLSSLLSL